MTPALTPPATRRIAFLIFPDFQILDAAGPIAAFEIAGRVAPTQPRQSGAYALDVIAAESGLVPSSSGVALPARGFGRPGAIDTLVIAGGDGTRRAMLCPRTRRFVRACAERARRVASVCSGSYVLAAAGLLDDRRATTHWSRTGDFRRRFPAVRLEADRIFVRDGKFWSSAGITAGIDLSLALITEDLGEAVARRVAQQLVVYYQRPGGQSQFSALLEMERPDGRFGALLDHVRANLASPLGVEDLADRVGMSPRHFARAFTAETGTTPAKAVERLRAEAARAALDGGSRSVQEVARACGFGDAERMRRAFRRTWGTTPSSLRRRVATKSPPARGDAGGTFSI
jgi:transcriptional regulator GlxA family with amidase domain